MATTKIDYGLPEVSNVKLMIYDILGREVVTLVNELQDPGYKSVTWHGKDDAYRCGGGYELRFESDSNSVLKNDTLRLWFQMNY